MAVLAECVEACAECEFREVDIRRISLVGKYIQAYYRVVKIQCDVVS